MDSTGVSFITPLKEWDQIGDLTKSNEVKGQNGEPSVFKDIFNQVVGQVYATQEDVENKQYLMATGQLDDAHTLPIAQAKAALSLDVMISLRNKALESYNELVKMSV